LLKQLSSRTRLLSLIGAVVVIGLVLWRCTSGGPEEPDYQTAQVQRGNMVARVSTSGSLSAVVTVDVGSQVSGRIQELFADFNSTVKKGQRIAKIDPALFEAAMVQASANVSAARANVTRLVVQAEEAERQARRASQVFAQQLISENDRDAAVSTARAASAAVEQAQGQLAQSQAALDQARTNLRYTDILSPTDGVVISRAVNVGQTVAASLQAPIIFTIAQDLRAMEVHTNVAESDIGRLQPKMKVSFTVDAYPGEPFRGEIREIRNAPQIVQNVVTYDAVINVDNSELKLKPGMTANVTVVTDRRRDVLQIPNAALRFRPEGAGGEGRARGAGPPGTPGAGRGPADAGSEGGRRPRDSEEEGGAASAERTVYVKVNGQPEPRRITAGISDGRNTEVTGGELKEGDAVIISAGGASAVPQRGGPRGGFRIL
jgi:HlyD family secretion protein